VNMINFIKFGGFKFFRSIRIIIALLKSTISVMLFEHHHYFVFCLALSAIQFTMYLFSGLLHSQLKLSTLLSASLAGFNYFEILIDSVSTLSAQQLLLDAALLFIQLLGIYLISSATAYYAMQSVKKEKQSIKESFLNASSKIKLLSLYAGLEVVITATCALMGLVGSLFYFIWQIIMVFKIQVITFEQSSFVGVFIKSIRSFKSNIANILGIDLIFEGSLIFIAFIGYFFYQKVIVEPVNLIADNYAIALIITYMLAAVTLVEVIVFTFLYQIITKHSLKK